MRRTWQINIGQVQLSLASELGKCETTIILPQSGAQCSVRSGETVDAGPQSGKVEPR